MQAGDTVLVRRSALAMLAGLAVAATVAAAGPFAMAGQSTAAICVVYMSPTGSDANNGLSRIQAVRTLVRVHQVLTNLRPNTDVEVRIEQGLYVAPAMQDWRFYVPGHTVSFMPIDYQYGEGDDGIAGRPVFRNARNANGTYQSGFWLQPRLPRDTSDPLYNGGTSGLRFYYLQVDYYAAGAVSIYGDSERDVSDESYNPPLRKKGSNGLNGNTLFGMVFTHLGNRWATGAPWGWGAIVLTNSSNNKIENNHFAYIENLAPNDNHIHGLYVTHFSSSNSLRGNRFSYNSGDPVKIRDRSNYNAVEDNIFTRSGKRSFYRDEFCDRQCAIDNSLERQCASYHNRFFNNRLITDYDGDNSSESWTLDPPGLTYAGVAPCSIPAGDQRLRTGGNTTS